MINPIMLLWGWDWDHQTYSREGFGFLGDGFLCLFFPSVFLNHVLRMAVCIEMCCVRMILQNHVCLKSHIEWMDMKLK